MAAEFARLGYVALALDMYAGKVAAPGDREAARRYIEAYEQISGRAFKPETDDPLSRIRRNLSI